MNPTARRMGLPLVAALIAVGGVAIPAAAEPPGGGDCTINADGANMRKFPNDDPPGVRGQEIHRRR